MNIRKASLQLADSLADKFKSMNVQRMGRMALVREAQVTQGLEALPERARALTRAATTSTTPMSTMPPGLMRTGRALAQALMAPPPLS